MIPDTTDPPAEVAPAEDEPRPEEDLQAATPDDLIHLARERARHGDYEGARLLAADALKVPGDHQPVARYLDALCLEFEGRLDEALAAYDALMRDAPSDDTRFRRAECLGKLGRVREARDQIADIARVRALSEADQLKIGVLSAVWELDLGRERKALKRLDALVRTPGDDAGYYRALGLFTLIEHALDAADAMAFVGSDAAKKKALEARAGLVAGAEQELADTIRTGEVSFALQGFLRLGRSYEDLGADMLAESPPKGLTDAQLAINRELLGEKVEKLWVKGTLFYDRGLQLAAKENWTTDPVQQLRDAKDELEQRVDAPK